MTRSDSFPRWAWTASVIVLAVALLIALCLLAATLSGIADPPRFGDLTIDEAFDSDSQSRVTAYEADAQIVKTLNKSIACPCTVELRVMQVSGPADAAYGLWWGRPDQSPETLVGATSDGYVAILPGDSAAAVPIRDWQIFPHVRPLGDGNTFRIDIGRGQITIGLNDEVVTEYKYSQRQISAGYFVESSRTGDAVFQLVSFKTWEAHRIAD